MLPLAVYGTLRSGQRNHVLLRGCEVLGAGRVRGRLHEVDTGEVRAYAYPALVVDGQHPPGGDDAGEVVAGEVVAVEVVAVADPALWRALDALEAYDEADVEGSEYVRATVEVLDGPVPLAQAYVYRGSASALGRVIRGGDWVAWTRHAGRVDPATRDPLR